MVRQVNAHANTSLITNDLAQGLPDYNPFLTVFVVTDVSHKFSYFLLAWYSFNIVVRNGRGDLPYLSVLKGTGSYFDWLFLWFLVLTFGCFLCSDNLNQFEYLGLFSHCLINFKQRFDLLSDSFSVFRITINIVDSCPILFKIVSNVSKLSLSVRSMCRQPNMVLLSDQKTINNIVMFKQAYKIHTQ